MGRVKVNPKIGFIFKKIFGVEENKDLLMDLINSVINENNQVSEIEILNPYNEKFFREDQQSIIEVKGKNIISDRWYKIEIQISNEECYNKRALYHCSKSYSDQIKKGFIYRDLMKTISINFLNFESIVGEKEYHNVYRMYNVKSKKEFIDDIEIHFIELTKYDGQTKIKSSLDKWTQFLKEAGEKEGLPQEFGEEITIKKAMSILENIQMNDEEREVYESKMNWLRDEVGAIETAKRKGMKKGIEAGVKEKSIEIAREMLEDEYPIKAIIKLTKLTEEEIEALKNK